MTNEELALQVRDGNMAAFEQLMQQCWGELRVKARHLWRQIGGNGNPYGVELGDMTQVALIGLYRACLAYDIAKGFPLLSYLLRGMQNAFRNQHKGLRHDAIAKAISLDAITGEKENDLAATLLDFLQDEAAQEDLLEVDEEDFRKYTKKQLETALAGLPKEQSEAIRLHCMEGVNKTVIAQENGVSVRTITRRIERGINTLRGGQQVQQYGKENIRAQQSSPRGTGLYVWRASDDSFAELPSDIPKRLPSQPWRRIKKEPKSSS